MAKELPAEPKPVSIISAVKASTLRILLVEDNPANQKLAAYILRDRGHTVEIAGRRPAGASTCHRTDQYDVILMDVQMPGMDGLEATAAIRAHERTAERVPIIAMTAHRNERRPRAVSGGRNGRLPVQADRRQRDDCPGGDLGCRPEDLQLASSDSPSRLCGACKSLPPVFDPELALKRCFNSPDMLSDMIQCFFDEVDSLFPQMCAALQKGDLVEVGRLGHRLKGTIVYLGAEQATEAVLGVEKFERHGGQLAEAEEALKILQQECDRLKAALAGHRLKISPV